MEALAAALADPGAFHRLTLVRRPADGGWSRVVGTPVTLREGVGVKLVATVGTRHETETVRPEEWAERREALLAEPFDQAHVQSPAGDVHARRTKKGRLLVSQGKPSRPEDVAVAAHDRPRGRALDLDDPDVVRLFIATGLAGDSGRIRAAARRQGAAAAALPRAAAPARRAAGRRAADDPRRRLRQGVHEPRARAVRAAARAARPR